MMMGGRLQADGKSIASYVYNVDVTRKVVDMAHTLSVTVECELGRLGSLGTMCGDKEDGHARPICFAARAIADASGVSRLARKQKGPGIICGAFPIGASRA